MIDPQWNQEKIALYLRWATIVIIFVCLFFYFIENPDLAHVRSKLLFLGIGAVLGIFVLQALYGRLEVETYHFICLFYDLIIITLLVKFTGGAFQKTTSGLINSNFFIFLFPLFVLNNSLGKTWYSGVGSALLASLALGYLVLAGGAVPAGALSLFFLLLLLNFATSATFVFKEQWIMIGDTGEEVNKRKKEVEDAYETLRNEIETRKKREQELYDKTSKLTTIIQVARALGSSSGLNDLFDTIVEKAREEMNSQMAFIMLEKDGLMLMVKSTGVSEITRDILKCRVMPGQGIIADVMLSSSPMRLNDIENKDRLLELAGATEKIKTLLVVPLIAPKDKKPLGVLGVANLYKGDRYSKENEDFLGIFAIEAAMFIRQMKLRHDLEISYFELIKTVAQFIEAKDPYTRGHVQRVSDYAVRLAKELKLSKAQIEKIEKAAILHDVGKIATPEHILNKPGKLTDEEFAIMKDHVVESRRMLADITSGIDDELRDYVGYHHERWDGKGYPMGLKGEEIPLGAQIIAVADTFDAMTSDRPYRKGFSTGEALAHLIDAAGTQFNPVVLYAFFDMLGFDKETGKLKPALLETRKLS